MYVIGSWQCPGYHRQQVTSRIDSRSMLLRTAVCTALSRNRGTAIVHGGFGLAKLGLFNVGWVLWGDSSVRTPSGSNHSIFTATFTVVQAVIGLL